MRIGRPISTSNQRKNLSLAINSVSRQRVNCVQRIIRAMVLMCANLALRDVNVIALMFGSCLLEISNGKLEKIGISFINSKLAEVWSGGSLATT